MFQFVGLFHRAGGDQTGSKFRRSSLCTRSRATSRARPRSFPFVEEFHAPAIHAETTMNVVTMNFQMVRQQIDGCIAGVEAHQFQCIPLAGASPASQSATCEATAASARSAASVRWSLHTSPLPKNRSTRPPPRVRLSTKGPGRSVHRRPRGR